MKKLFNIALLITVGIFLIGCGTSKVLNINKTYKKDNNLKKMEEVILKAGKQLTWNMSIKKEGKIIGDIVVRGHSAKIEVLYDKNSYKINYINSTNLQYDSVNNTIHSNYNGWINNLSVTINNELEELVYDKKLMNQAKQVSLDKENAKSTESGTRIIDVSEKFNPTSLKTIESAIIQSGERFGWRVEKQKDGLILARLAIRTHIAIVKIEYSTESYKLTYLSSKNLIYDNETYTIHNNYNGWVKNFTSSINNKLN